MSRIHIVLAVGAAGLLYAGCGDGREASNSDQDQPDASSAAASQTETPAGAPTPTNQKAAQEAVDPALGSPGDVPRIEGGDNSIQDFGSEASPAERRAAATVLVTYLRAYADGNANGACALLATRVAETLERAAQTAAGADRPPESCPAALERITRGLPPESRKLVAQARVLSVRVDGERAFAIYDGAHKLTYSMPMLRERETWTVGGLVGTPLP